MIFSGCLARDYTRRNPIRFSEPPTYKNKNKWDKIITTFMEGRKQMAEKLQQIQR